MSCDIGRLAECVSDAGDAALDEALDGLVRGDVIGDDDELISAEPGESIRSANGVAQVDGDALEELIADIVSQGVIDALEAVEIEHQEGRAGAVLSRLLDSCGKGVLEVAAIGETCKVIVEGIPLVAVDLLLQQNKQHADGDEKLLEIPDLVGDGVVPGMAGHPRMREKDEGPGDKTDDDGDFAETLPGKVELEYGGRGEIKDEEREVGGGAKTARGDKEPDGYPCAGLSQNEPPSVAELRGALEQEKAGYSSHEARRGDNVIDMEAM